MRANKDDEKAKEERLKERESLRVLESLTFQLPVFGELVKTKVRSRDFEEIDTEKGSGFRWSLFSDDNICVSRCFISTNAILPESSLEDIEWIIVYEGKMVAKYKDKTVELSNGSYVFHGKNVPYKLEVVEDVWFIDITIQTAKDFPK